MFSGLLKESKVWRFVILNKIIVTLDTQGSEGLASSFLSLPFCVSSLVNANYASLFAMELVENLLVSEKTHFCVKQIQYLPSIF